MKAEKQKAAAASKARPSKSLKGFLNRAPEKKEPAKQPKKQNKPAPKPQEKPANSATQGDSTPSPPREKLPEGTSLKEVLRVAEIIKKEAEEKEEQSETPPEKVLIDKPAKVTR